MKARSTGFTVSFAIALASILLFAPAASAHTGVLTATVPEKSLGASAPQAHTSATGHWCASVTAITGSVGKWWLTIRNGSDVIASVGNWHPSSSTLGGVSCSPSIGAGEYSATLYVRGGKSGSTLTVELDHPE